VGQEAVPSRLANPINDSIVIDSWKGGLGSNETIRHTGLSPTRVHQLPLFQVIIQDAPVGRDYPKIKQASYVVLKASQESLLFRFLHRSV
jgi:hypothetical protein